MKKNSLLAAFLTAIIIGGLFLVTSVHFGAAQSGTNVSGIITVDSTWTQANSPYTLTGPVAVNSGVNLTLQTGATVNLNNYYIQVNGTLNIKSGVTINSAATQIGGVLIQVNGLLVAVGSSANPIHINGVSLNSITFSQTSTNWNDQVGSGCIIQNAIINSTSLSIASSVKIDNNTIIGGISAFGSPIISNNNITGGITASHSSVILNNNITGVATLLSATITVILGDYIGATSSANSFPIFANNTLFGGRPTQRGDENIGVESYGYASITNNTISGCAVGIASIPYENATPSLGFPLIDSNVLLNDQVGIYVGNPSSSSTGSNTPLIQRNILTQDTYGLSFWGDSAPLIQNNTIAGNSIGINEPSPTSIMIYNNIQNNIQSSIYLQNSANFNATYNWWGTIDQQTINQTIYDYKDNFNLGNVTFIPFLNTPNPEAPTYFTASAGSGGSINPSGVIRVNYSGSQGFSITPNSGYYVVDVLVNGSSVGAVSSYTAQNIQGATTISATFAPNPTPTPSPTPSPSPTPTATPIPSSTPSSTPTPSLVPTATPSSTAAPSPTTVTATTDKGATVNLSINGNVTSSQMSNIEISSNQSASTTTLSFTVTGQSGTTGFGNVTLPKSAVHYGTTPTIYIDGQSASNQGYIQDANNYYVWYTTHFSTHEVTIVFTAGSSIPEFSWLVILPLFISILYIVVILKLRHRKPVIFTAKF